MAEVKRAVRKVFRKDPEKASYFEKLVIKFLNELHADLIPIQHALSIVECVAIIPVQNQTTNAYLILSSSSTNVSLHEVCLDLCLKLSNYLRQEGKVYEIGFPALVECSSHDFLSTENNHLIFSHVAELGDGQLGVKLLATEEPLPKAQKVETSPHYLVEDARVPANYPVDFKLYIHLEKNQKYVVLVKEGGVFSDKYRKRLADNGKGLYIDEESLDKFKRFCTTVRALSLLNVTCHRVHYLLEKSKEKPAA